MIYSAVSSSAASSAPVVDLQIVVHQVLVVQQGGVNITNLLALLTVEDICLGDLGVAGVGQNLFYAVLDVFHSDETVLDLGFKVGTYLQSQQIDDAGMILTILSLEGLDHRRADFGNFEFDGTAVTLQNLIHIFIPPVETSNKNFNGCRRIPVGATASVLYKRLFYLSICCATFSFETQYIVLGVAYRHLLDKRFQNLGKSCGCLSFRGG